MGRKQAAELELEAPEDESIERPPAASRRSRTKPEPRTGWRERLRRVLRWTGAGVVVVGVAAAYYQIDEFLASGPQFMLLGSPTAAINPNFTVEGVVYTPRADVMNVFARDFGRSVYLIPLAERRRSLMAIDWIRDATILRHWPNRIVVRVVERKPVAFAMLPGNGAGFGVSETALIDSDGVLLRLPPKAQFSLPALFGVTRADSPATRRARAGQAVELIRELQGNAAQVSEIDVSDPENLTITEVAQGRAVRLLLGNRNYASRLGSFLTHYPDISRRLPNARTFDLRLDGHITAREGGTDAR